MVGLVVASHGRLADELVATARQIVGDVPLIATLSVEPGCSPEDIRARIKDAVKSVEQGDGVLVFADLIGGSPCTQSLSLCNQTRLEVVTGVNLPMLLKANTLRHELPLRDLANELAAYGQKNIACATELMRARSSAA
ncbi:MAG: PTS sugar transporter subunit IIA [Myxococcaceae bacterium]|nr:PTS sugar transporter subunit IIA [Myxococcaceae bacterium]